MNLFKAYHEAFQPALGDFNRDQSPNNLYQPMQYLLDLGGKRIRPFLTLMAGEAFGVSLKMPWVLRWRWRCFTILR